MSTIYYNYTSPSLLDKVKSKCHLPNKAWIHEAFPITQWLPKYNSQWFISDLICAATVGVIIIPQVFAYASMGNLPPYYGVYASIVGLFIYPFIGTSKDISIGATAINSLLFGQVLAIIQQTPQFQSGEWSLPHVTTTLALLSGIICFGLSMLRLGILYDFICQPAIAGFMGGSSITIVVNQLNKILGIKDIDTTQSTLFIFINTLKKITDTHWDAMIGVCCLLYIYGARYYSQLGAKKYPKYGRFFFYFGITRNIVAVVVATLVSYLINHFGHFEESPFHIAGLVPVGLPNKRIPVFDIDLIKLALPNMIGICVLQVMEHCSISSSLGKMTGYKINVNQEVLSIGLANIFGSFLGAYPCTGAFSRSAVMSKSGSRTPLTNIFVGIMLLITIYFFTPALSYIPMAAIGAIVTHAVTDLISGPKVWVKYWNTHPSELIIFASAYIISLVARIDIGVYAPVLISLIVQLYRISRPKYAFLGRLHLSSSTTLMNQKTKTKIVKENGDDDDKELITESHDEKSLQPMETISSSSSTFSSIEKSIFVAFDDPVLSQHVQPIGQGIICFQPRENLVFENVNYLYGALMDEVKKQTKSGQPLSESMGSRPWNDAFQSNKNKEKPILQSIILDFSGVHVMDYSAMEQLAELTRMVEKYCGHPIPWFIVISHSEIVRHSLLYAGFGRQQRKKIGGTVFPFHNDIKKKKKKKMPESTHRFGDIGCQQQHEYYSYYLEHDHPIQPPTSLEELEKKDDSVSMISYQSFDYVPQWCDCHNEDDCQLEENDDHEKQIEMNHDIHLHQDIRYVRDWYPYFFRNLHEAVHIALNHPQQYHSEPFKSSPSDDTVTIQIDHPKE
ncbi:unnamed protein product [Cunninghamella blakesleeana]